MPLLILGRHYHITNCVMKIECQHRGKLIDSATCAVDKRADCLQPWASSLLGLWINCDLFRPNPLCKLAPIGGPTAKCSQLTWRTGSVGIRASSCTHSNRQASPQTGTQSNPCSLGLLWEHLPAVSTSVFQTMLVNKPSSSLLWSCPILCELGVLRSKGREQGPGRWCSY